MENLEKRFEDNLDNSFLHLLTYDVDKDIPFDQGFDFIIHAASNAYPAAFSANPVGTITGNVIGTLNLLNYGLSHGTKRLLYVSSGEVYGQLPNDTPMFTEDMSGYVDPTQVRSCYPASKRLAENLCVSFSRQFGLDTVIVRPCHTYGANVTSKDNRATVQFFNDVLNSRDIVLKSEGKPIRSYMYVADSVAAILSVLLVGESGNAYNISNPDSIVSIREFAELTAELSGRKVVIQLPAEKPVDDTPITRQVLCADKLSAIGFRSAFTCREGIESSLAIMKGDQ